MSIDKAENWLDPGATGLVSETWETMNPNPPLWISDVWKKTMNLIRAKRVIRN
jgi:hypothetical protein